LPAGVLRSSRQDAVAPDDGARAVRGWSRTRDRGRRVGVARPTLWGHRAFARSSWLSCVGLCGHVARELLMARAWVRSVPLTAALLAVACTSDLPTHPTGLMCDHERDPPCAHGFECIDDVCVHP